MRTPGEDAKNQGKSNKCKWKTTGIVSFVWNIKEFRVLTVQVSVEFATNQIIAGGCLQEQVCLKSNNTCCCKMFVIRLKMLELFRIMRSQEFIKWIRPSMFQREVRKRTPFFFVCVFVASNVDG